MKVLAISDTHIGAGYEHRKDALADTDAMFAQVTRLTVERDVDVVLHAGDPYHRAKPTPAEYYCFKQFCDGLATAGIPMIVLDGNGLHAAAPGQISAVQMAESRLVRVSRRPEVVTEFAGVAVCTLPAQPVSRLVAARNGGSREEAYEQAVDLLLRTARDLFDEAPSDRPRILLAHQMVSGASLPTGLPVDSLGGVVLPLHELERIGFDAMIFGDIHAPQALESAPFAASHPAWYCGSPICCDFGEADTEHGVWIWDTYGAPEFVPLEQRRFVTVDVDLAGEVSERGVSKGGESTVGDHGSSPDGHEIAMASSGSPRSLTSIDETDLIAAYIAEHLPLTDAVVRVRYTATEEQRRRVDHAALHRLLADAGIHKLHGGLQWIPVRESRARVEGFTEEPSTR